MGDLQAVSSPSCNLELMTKYIHRRYHMLLQRTRQKLSQLPWLRLSIPLIALALLLVCIIRPQLQIDAITLGLLAVAALPWLTLFIQDATIPGGWTFTFRRIEAKQLQQQVEIDTLNFLITHFVTTNELNHFQPISLSTSRESACMRNLRRN